LRKPKVSTITQTQVRETNSVQPSRSSAISPGCAAAAGTSSVAGSRSRAKHSAETAKLLASTTRPHPGPIVATRTPPSDVPRICAELAAIRFSAFAGCRSSAGTVCGVSAAEAGSANAANNPFAADSTISTGTVALCVSTSVATDAWVAALSSPEPTSTR